MRSIPRILINLLVFIGFIAGGAIVYMQLTAETPTAGFGRPNINNAPIVNVESLELAPYSVSIRATGTVESLQSGDINAELAGRVIAIEPTFTVGQTVQAEDVLARIDDSEYQSALIQARSQLDSARLALTQERAQSEVAQNELRRTGRSVSSNPLAARLPQVQSAQAGVEAAQSNLTVVENRVAKSVIKAPFTGQITAKNIVVGQQLNAGFAIGSVSSDTNKRIKINIPSEELASIEQFTQRISDVDSIDFTNIIATVTITSGGIEQSFSGQFDNDSSMINNQSQLLSAYVNLTSTENERLLSVGSLVDVVLSPEQQPVVMSLPIASIGQNNSVRILSGDNNRQLESKIVNPVWWGNDRVIIGAGLELGETVVTTPLPSNILDGTVVRLSDDPVAEPKSRDDTKATASAETINAQTTTAN